jgi:hypothetical protein
MTTDIERGSEPPVIASPNGVGGWLLYICVAFSVLGPIKMLEFIRETSTPIMQATYTAIAATSFVAGSATWLKLSSAFIFLRIALIVRLLYGFFQVYLGVGLTRQPQSLDLAKREFLSAALNIALVLVLYFYFRFSKRVLNTFGRNI